MESWKQVLLCTDMDISPLPHKVDIMGQHCILTYYIHRVQCFRCNKCGHCICHIDKCEAFSDDQAWDFPVLNRIPFFYFHQDHFSKSPRSGLIFLDGGGGCIFRLLVLIAIVNFKFFYMK